MGIGTGGRTRKTQCRVSENIWHSLLKRKSPFGISLRKKDSQQIAPGDIIQVSNNFYVVHEVGSRKIQVND